MKTQKLKFIKLIALSSSFGLLVCAPFIMSSCSNKKDTSNLINLSNVENSLSEIKQQLNQLTYGYDIDTIRNKIMEYLNKNSDVNNKLKWISFDKTENNSNGAKISKDNVNNKVNVNITYHFDESVSLNGDISNYEIDNINKTISIKNVETNIEARKNAGVSSLGFSETDPYKISWDLLKLKEQNFSFPKTLDDLNNLFKNRKFSDIFSDSIGLTYGIDFEYIDFEFISASLKTNEKVNEDKISYMLKLKPKAKIGSDWRDDFNLWKDKEMVFELSENLITKPTEKAGTSALDYKNYGLDWNTLFKSESFEAYPNTIDEANKIFSNKFFMIALSNRILNSYHDDFEYVQFNFKSIDIINETIFKNSAKKYKLVMQVVARPGYDWYENEFGYWKDKDLSFELSNNSTL